MPKRQVNVPGGGQLAELDLVSHGRRGRETPLQFSPAEIEQIRRTVRGVPEVMVKVSGGGKSAAGVQAHFAYIDRHGKLEVHTDEGERLQGKDVAAHLVDDWNLDAGKGQYRPEPKAGEKDTRPKQVHNIVFSMPAGTPPEKLLAATQTFARQKFADKHRYALVLHTDQRHPHVHLVVKAQSEEGDRLHIRKATLRQWRADFASELRELGVAANATPTALRGRPKSSKPDGIYRALKRGQSTFIRRRVKGVAEELRRGHITPEPGRRKLLATRAKVVEAWEAAAAVMRANGQEVLAKDVEAYVQRMPAVVTEKEGVAKGLLSQLLTRGSPAHDTEPEHPLVRERTR